MPNLYNYFDNDFVGFRLDRIITLEFSRNNEIEKIEINERVIDDLKGGTRFFIYYIPNSKSTAYIVQYFIRNVDKYRNEVSEYKTNTRYPTDILLGDNQTVYSNQIYFYTECMISKEDLEILHSEANKMNLHIVIRNEMYKNKRIELDSPMAFISHDSKDKDLIARPIAESLSQRLCTVWYDEFSLKIGDSLRESIEEGIKKAKKCVLILTPNFLNNPGWGKKEFNSIFTREMIFEQKIILPIWYNVSPKDVYNYSPSLADTFALNWPENENNKNNLYKKEIEIVVSKLHTAIIN